MKRFLKFVDRKLRLDDQFFRLRSLRSWLRRPYHHLLNTFGGGAEIQVGGLLPITVPAEFGSKEMESYEVDSVAAISEWIKREESCLFVDIGCSLGYLSCSVLSNSTEVQVVAIDSDVHSLAATRRLCTFQAGASGRIELLNCFIGPSATKTANIDEARALTNKKLGASEITGKPGTTNYVNLEKRNNFSNIPVLTLDQLLEDRLSLTTHLNGSECLVKCDIEGAEELMLQGATDAMGRYGVWMLLSVHPQFLERYGSNKSDIMKILSRNGYSVEVLSMDHEEHWMCKPER